MYSKHTLHIVEDDPTTRRLLENLTSLLGYQVEPHNNSDEPWEALAMIDPRIVISDYKIPDKDGLELCRRVRGMRSDTYTCCIFVTAQLLSPSNLEQAINAGVDDCLKKRIGFDEIWNRLRIAELILGLNKQVKTLESLIPICAQCEKSGMMTIYGNR